MATTAASVGTPQPRKRNQANLTAARDVAGARKSAPQKRRKPPLGLSARQLGAAGVRAQRGQTGASQFGGQPMRGWGAPAGFGGQPLRGGPGPSQFQGQPMPGAGGPGGGGGQYPGSTNWWGQRPQMPSPQQWGSPQFNYRGGFAPSAQPGPSPPWGGGGYGGGGPTPMPTGSGQPGNLPHNTFTSEQEANRAGYSRTPGGEWAPMNTGYQSGVFGAQQLGGGQQQMPGQYQTGGRPFVGGGGFGQQQYGGGMPGGGMPSYGMPGLSNSAYGPLQQRIMMERMQNQMPSALRQQMRFQQGAGYLGIDPYQMQGYGTAWGPGGASDPWRTAWNPGSQAPPPPPSGRWGGQRGIRRGY